MIYFVGDYSTDRQQDLNALGITNFSFDSESYFDVYNKLNYLIRNHSVETIYLCVDDHTLSHYRQYWTNGQHSIYFSDYQDYKRWTPFLSCIGTHALSLSGLLPTPFSDFLQVTGS